MRPPVAAFAETWPLIPVTAGTKEACRKDWRERTFGPDDFPDGCNVGVKLGVAPAHLVDFDCDVPEARAAASELLPLTLVHGRSGAKGSHYWFSCPGIVRNIWKDLDQKMLVELRGTGHQTVVPPSIHFTGQPLEWENDRTPLAMTPEDLKAVARDVAIVALLARHWPGGSRHIAVGHLGGVLGRLGLDPAQVERIVRVAAREAKDEEVADRGRFARESAQKIADGATKVTGAPKFAEMWPDGPALLRQLYLWFGLDGEERIEQINAKHFVVELGSDRVVGYERRADSVQFYTFDQFRKKYYNQYSGDGKTRLGQAWLSHRHNRWYSGRVIWAPPASDVAIEPEDYNLWRGFAAEPSTHDQPETLIPRYLEHITDVICDGQRINVEWVLDLLADCVQRPGAPVGKMLALRGDMGLGKGLFIENFGRLFGPHYAALYSPRQLLGNFNAHLSGKIVIFADEAIWAGMKQAIGVLKRIITENMIAIERKNLDIIFEHNFVHIFSATNKEWAYPLENKDRRGNILDVTRKMPQSYFDTLVAETKSPTFQPALLAYLQRRVVDYARLRRGLETPVMAIQQDMGAEAVQQWWRQVLEEGSLSVYDQVAWPSLLPLPQAYDQFVTELGSRGAGLQHHVTRYIFTQKLKALLPPDVERTTARVALNVAPIGAPPQVERRAVHALRLPSLRVCREFYDVYTGLRREWPEIDPEQTNRLD